MHYIVFPTVLVGLKDHNKSSLPHMPAAVQTRKLEEEQQTAKEEDTAFTLRIFYGSKVGDQYV